MTTLIVFISSLGFYLIYNTSQKADLNRSEILEKWAQEHPQASKYIGVFLFAISLILSMIHYGISSGIFSFFVILMTVASMIVLLAPLRYINYKLVSVVFLLSILLEII
jgi:hypothetical protein